MRLAGVLVISLGTFSDKPLYADMSQIELQDKEPVFQLKGSMLAITVLELARNNLEALDRQLAAKVAQAPNFFSNTPLVLALDKALREGRYAPALWQKQTGKALPALWAQYVKPRSDAPAPAPSRRGKRH